VGPNQVKLALPNQVGAGAGWLLASPLSADRKLVQIALKLRWKRLNLNHTHRRYQLSYQPRSSRPARAHSNAHPPGSSPRLGLWTSSRVRLEP
jgi:hypothetical protein